MAQRLFIAENSEPSLKMINDRQWYIREGTSDETAVAEVFHKREYRKAVIRSGDVWLDGGANIGAFSVYASGLCRRVVAFEPSEGNLSVAERNLEVNGITNVVLVNAALVGDDRSEVLLYLNTGKGKTLHTTVLRKTRPAVRVPAVNINDAISEYGVTKLKIDVEGEEVGIVRGLTDDSLDQIDEIIMEWHPYLGGPNRSQRVYDECISKLRRRLPQFEGRELIGTSGWGFIVHLSSSLGTRSSRRGA